MFSSAGLDGVTSIRVGGRGGVCATHPSAPLSPTTGNVSHCTTHLSELLGSVELIYMSCFQIFACVGLEYRKSGSAFLQASRSRPAETAADSEMPCRRAVRRVPERGPKSSAIDCAAKTFGCLLE